MVETTTARLAEHGWSCTIPACWEAIINRGDWGSGYVVLAQDSRSTLNLSWHRDTKGVDVDRTIIRLNRRLQREARDQQYVLSSREELHGTRGVLVRWSGRDGDLFGIIIHPPECPVTFIMRQLRPGTAQEIRDVALSCQAVGDDDPAAWCIHGLDLVLPPRWRLEGIGNLVGLTRAVWMHYPDDRQNRIDQVLIVRRIACPERLLGNRNIASWLRDSLDKSDRILSCDEADGVVWLTINSPAQRLWDRLRRIRDVRHFQAWIETASGRLVVQEWKGSGPPMPCLRQEKLNQDPLPP